jgi:catechol 2,3-dioxygenase-like lactoylglutathione lyase family enzyme
VRTAVLEKRIATAARSVPPMLTSLSHTFIYVLDHDQAVEFYVGKLGLEVGVDADLGPFRWLTVHVAGQPESSIVLATPDMGHDEETAAEIRKLVVKGGGNGVIFNVDDCRRTYDELVAKGVEFTQEPTEHFYGIDCGLRDPFGNPLRITQPAPQPLKIPTPEELAANR